MQLQRSHVAHPGFIYTLLIAVTSFVTVTSDPAFAQTCTPHPTYTDCTPPPAFQCPVDQAGAFCPGEPPFLAPLGNGVQPSGNQLLIDQTCNGAVNDPGDLTVSIPSEIQNLTSLCSSCMVEYRLSPTQDDLYVRVYNDSSAVTGCSPDHSRIYFYEIDAGTATLIPFTGDQGVCVPSPISVQPVFHDEVGYPIRTAVLVGDQSLSVPVLWADLVGREINLDTFSYAPVVQIPRFSPAGDAVLLTSIVGGLATDFALVDLCVSPIAATGSITNRTANGAVSGQVLVISGNPVAEITHGASVDSFTLSGCVCGACCDGASCTANVFAADCTGTFFPGVGCSPTPCGGSQNYTLVVDAFGPGTITSDIGGINCPFAACDANYPEDTIVELTATPSPGKIFVDWSGDCSGTNPVVNVTMDADHACVASFRDQQADLELLSIVANGSPFVAGTVGTFDVTVRNNGPEPVSAFSLSVTPPAGFTFNAASSDPACGSLQCSLTGTLNAGQTRTVTVGYLLDPALRGDQIVSASVSGFLQDPVPNNNSRSVNVFVIGVANLSLTASAAPNPAPAGELMVIQAQVTNHGPSTATALSHNRIYPASIHEVDKNGNPLAGMPSDCAIQSLSVGGTNPAQFIVQIDPNAVDGSQHMVSLSVVATETDPDLANNSADVIITVGGPSSVLPNQRLVTLLSYNDPAPSGLGLFKGFYNARIQGENTVFLARTDASSNVTGVFRTIGTQVSVVADFQTVAPRYHLPFDNFDGPVLDGLDVYFNGIYLFPFNYAGIHTQSQCGVETLMFTGDPAPGILGEIAYPVPQAFANGQMLVWNNGELLLWQDGIYTPVALRDQLTPGGGGATFVGMSLESDFDGQTVVFHATSTNNLRGIYYSQNGVLNKLVDSTDLRPDTGTPFDYFDPETAIDNGYIVFARDGGLSPEHITIYGYDIAADHLEVIVGSNTPMPGGERNFERISAPADVDDGRVLFIGYGPGLRGWGIYLWENGVIRRVLARPATNLARDTFDGNRMIFQNEMIIGKWGDPGDFDLNGLVDAADGQALLGCFSGPDVLQNPFLDPNAVDCLSAFDANADDDVDALDYLIWQRG